MREVLHSYGPEKQAGSVLTAQKDGLLKFVPYRYKGHIVVEELGQEWIVMGDKKFLRGRDFDEESLLNIERGATLIMFRGENQFKAENGIMVSPIAAVYDSEGSRIYKSPAFDESSYEANIDKAVGQLKKMDRRKAWKQMAQDQRTQINRRKKGR